METLLPNLFGILLPFTAIRELVKSKALYIECKGLCSLQNSPVTAHESGVYLTFGSFFYHKSR
jgi:hypothetical protein